MSDVKRQFDHDVPLGPDGCHAYATVFKRGDSILPSLVQFGVTARASSLLTMCTHLSAKEARALGETLIAAAAVVEHVDDDEQVARIVKAFEDDMKDGGA